MRTLASFVFALFSFSLSQAQTLTGTGATAPIQNAVYLKIKTTMDAGIAANKITFNDGSTGYSAAPSYVDVYVIDFWLTASQYPSAFPASTIYNIYRKFIAAKDGSGNMPISITPDTAAAAAYYSGLDNVHFHTGGDPIWCVPLLAQLYYNQTGDTATLAADLAVMDAALQSVPRNNITHLVSAGTTPGTLWIGVGFQDGVQKSGDDLLSSLMMWQANRAMSQLYTAIGNSAKSSAYAADAALIAANIDTLWDATDGMFYAASTQNKQIDINGSALAVVLGLASPTETTAIASYMFTNAGTLFNASGYVRQSPSNWAFVWSGSTYDNNYWTWGQAWVLATLARNNVAKATAQANAFIYATNNDYEYFIGNSNAGAANNMETPAGVFYYVANNLRYF